MKQYRVIISAITALLITACVNDIEYKGPDGKRMLIVNSITPAGQVPVFEMSHSAFFLDSYYTGNVLDNGVDVTVNINGQSKVASYVDSLKGYTDDRVLNQGDIISVQAYHPQYGTVHATDTVPFGQSCTVSGYKKEYVPGKTIGELFDWFRKRNPITADSVWVVEVEIGERKNITDYYILTIEPTMTYSRFNDTLGDYETIIDTIHYKVPANTKIILGQASAATALLEATEASQMDHGLGFFIFDDLYIKENNKVSFDIIMEKPDTLAYIYTYDKDSIIIDTKSYSIADKIKDEVTYNANIKLYTLSRTYYYYHKSATDFKSTTANFMSEPVTVLHNVTGGAGILATYASVAPDISYTYRDWK